MQYSVALPRSEPTIRVFLENLRGKCNFLASRLGRYTPMCGRLRVGKKNLHVCSLGRCGHVFGL